MSQLPKYKVFDKKLQTMHYPTSGSINPYDIDYEVRIWDTGWELVAIDASGARVVCGQEEGGRDDGILLRSTGLRDGQSTEIYEHDIVRIGKSYKAEVQWDEHAARFLLKPISAGAMSTRSLSSVVTQGRVIGNAHEHPLLKGGAS